MRLASSRFLQPQARQRFGPMTSPGSGAWTTAAASWRVNRRTRRRDHQWSWLTFHANHCALRMETEIVPHVSQSVTEVPQPRVPAAPRTPARTCSWPAARQAPLARRARVPGPHAQVARHELRRHRQGRRGRPDVLTRARGGARARAACARGARQVPGLRLLAGLFRCSGNVSHSL